MPEIDGIYALISSVFSQEGIDAAMVNLFMMAADEIFSNIVNYGFEGPREGMVVEVTIQAEGGMASMTFRDEGKPFNPLSQPPPDVSLGLNERSLGGLGLYIVKNSFDDLRYSREEGSNVFTVKKYLK
jgi:anti-sigma regulatory factor (Ser/Thr protein kinase)